MGKFGSDLVDLVLKVRVEVQREQYPDVDDTAIYDAEELLRNRLDPPVEGNAEVLEYEFILAAVKQV